jgi:hypothetical protein
MMIYLFLWLIMEEISGLIKIEADLTALPTAVSYTKEYARMLS